MKRKLYMTLAMLFTLGFTTPSDAAPMKVFVEGKEVGFSATPFTQKDTTMVPMREFFEAMGANVTYFPINKQITAKKNGTEVNMTLNYYTAFVNGKKTMLTAAPTLINDKTYVPLRFVGEAFNADVDYNQAWGTINIKSRQTIEPSQQPEKQQSSRTVWQVTMPTAINGLTVDNKGQLTVTSGSRLYQYSNTGQKNWELDLTRTSLNKDKIQVLGIPQVSSIGHIYVGSNDRQESIGFTKSLYHVLPDGTLKWNYLACTAYEGKTTASVAGVAIAPLNYVYTTMKKSLFQVYVDGTKKWEYGTTKELSSCVVPIGQDGDVLIMEAEPEGRLYRVDQKGTQDWYREIPGINDGKIILLADKNRILILSQNSKNAENLSTIYCVDGQTGNYVWTYRSKEKITTSLALRGNEVLYGTDKGIQAIDYTNEHKGVILQEQTELVPVVTAEGGILLYTGNNNLKLFDKMGKLEWSEQLPAKPISIASADNRVYVATENNLLLAIKK